MLSMVLSSIQSVRLPEVQHVCHPHEIFILCKLERSDIESSSSIHLRGLRTSCLESRYCDAWRCRLELEFVRYTWMQHRKWTLLLPSYVSRLCAFGCALPATVRKSKLFGLNGPGNGRKRIDLPLLRRNACSKDSNRASRRDGKDLMVDYPRPCKGRLMVSALAEHRSIQHCDLQPRGTGSLNGPALPTSANSSAMNMCSSW